MHFYISLIILRMRNLSGKSYRENKKKYSNTFLFENLAVYEMTWENILESGRPQMTIWRMRNYMVDKEVYKHTLRICNT